MERITVNLTRWSIKPPWGATEAHTYTYIWSMGWFRFSIDRSMEAGEASLL